MIIQNITGTYNLVADPSWRLLQLYEVYLECDTTLGAVSINLFKISDLKGFWNAKIYITDKNKNASNNPITVNCNSADSIEGGSQLTINQNSGALWLAVSDNNTWVVTGSVGLNEYKFATLPTSVVSQAVDTSQLWGEYIENAGFTAPANYVFRLNNGNLAVAFYPETILSDGTLIYEAYDQIDQSGIYGYWVAFKPSAIDQTTLIKVAELQMTSQFWDYFYDYTYQTESVPNQVKFLLPNYPVGDGYILQTWTTTLTLNNGVLSAVDTIVGPGVSVLTLYNDLTGESVLTGSWNYSNPYYAMNDDFYRMMDGPNAGWIWYAESNIGDFVYQVGYNTLTGQTKLVQPIIGLSSTTNFNPAGAIDETFFNGAWQSHPKGVLYLVSNQQSFDSGQNFNDVGAFWSPEWVNNTRVTFLPIRDTFTGEYINSGTFLFSNTLSPSYTFEFDRENFYSVLSTYASATYGAQQFRMTKIKLDTKDSLITESVLPAELDTSVALPSVWPTEKGLIMFWVTGASLETFSSFVYYYWNYLNNKPLVLQSNNAYPTNALDNKIYSTSSQLNKNTVKLGIQYDIYNQKF